MTSTLPDLSRATLNDIIFEGRNKAYGAYELRSIYHRHLKRATVAMLFVCAALALGPRGLAYLGFHEQVTPVKPVVDEKPYEIQPLPKFEEPAPAAKPVVEVPTPVVATEQFAPPLVVPDDKPVADPALASMALINQADNTGAHTVAGADGPLPVAVAEPVPAPATPEDVLVYSEVSPEFPGGLKALQKYIAENTRYSPLALRHGVEGKVYVRFVVDETGRVINPVVIKGIGYGCDEEALRMLQAMPAFKPGIQNGRPVKVYFNLPIVFKAI